jgi:DNA repair protein RadA/Sms
MTKFKVKYICTHCGFESLRWLGKCPQCDNWNSFSEEIVEQTRQKTKPLNSITEAIKLSEISALKEDRIQTGILEFDRVLGGGLIPGSVVLIGGDPGIGKSTLVMQAASKLKKDTLYVTGEESSQQIKLRASRLKIKSDSLYILPETDLDQILSSIKAREPSVVIIDSIQTIHNSTLDNSAGTITQIRECTSSLMESAKKNNFAVIIIGHVTKEGVLAGPKVLEHIVDTVIQFEGESNHSYRILRAIKNRFGSTNEIGIFEMHEEGLTEIKNPSELFINARDKGISGSIITASVEGTRPILIEVQALVTPSNFGNPQRVTTGFDYRRLSILLAVLERRSGYKVSASNVFINITGGIKIFEPAVDLAICSAVASSLTDKIADSSLIAIGEVGLGGEIRNVGNIEKRIQEAAKLGFKKVVLPEGNKKDIKQKFEIELIGVDNINQAINNILK